MEKVEENCFTNYICIIRATLSNIFATHCEFFPQNRDFSSIFILICTIRCYMYTSATVNWVKKKTKTKIYTYEIYESLRLQNRNPLAPTKFPLYVHCYTNIRLFCHLTLPFPRSSDLVVYIIESYTVIRTRYEKKNPPC